MTKPRQSTHVQAALLLAGFFLGSALSACQGRPPVNGVVSKAPEVSAQATAAATRLEELHNRTAARIQEDEPAEETYLSPEEAAVIAVKAADGAPLRSIARVVESEKVAYQIQVGDQVIYVDARSGELLRY